MFQLISAKMNFIFKFRFFIVCFYNFVISVLRFMFFTIHFNCIIIATQAKHTRICRVKQEEILVLMKVSTKTQNITKTEILKDASVVLLALRVRG